MKIALSTLPPADTAWLEATFNRNRARFGDLRMEAEVPPPAPAPQPAPPPGPAPKPGPPAPAPPAGQLGPNGFPLSTPWREMEKDQQVAYWVFQGNKHQEELGRAQAKLQEIEPKAAQFDALTEASKSELEKQRDAAIAESEKLRQEAAAAKRTFGTQLVESRLSAAAGAKGMTPDALKTLAGDLSRFLADDGVNGEAVDTFLAALPDSATGQPPRQNLNLGGGRRDPAKSSGVAAGMAKYREEYGRNRTT